MNTELIRKRWRGQRPHGLRTSDAQVFTIPHPEFVPVGRCNVVMEDENGLIEVIDPLHVVSIRSVPPRRARNGGGRR